MPRQIDIHPPVAVMEWVGDAATGRLRLLDQRRLPTHVEFIDCRDTRTLWEAIRTLAVRGAPAIGVAAAYGMVLAAQQFPSPLKGLPAEASAKAGEGRVRVSRSLLNELKKEARYLESSRPTAVNLAWAVRRMLACSDAVRRSDPMPSRAHYERTLADHLLAEARAIHAEDQAMCLAIGRHAVKLVKKCRGVLTHCNAGALATAGIGTATAGLYLAHAAGHKFRVFCDETRPLLQGARLTAWELSAAGIDAVLITDNMAAHVMREGKVGMVIVGADRIAANGDTANKIGTYGVAIAARHHKIPFYVAAPYSTFDLSIPDGSHIPIELRGGDEITSGFGKRTAPDGIATYCPAFDVTPAELITGIITDRGVIKPVTRANIKRVVARGLARRSPAVWRPTCLSPVS